jgi:hypothetical protein
MAYRMSPIPAGGITGDYRIQDVIHSIMSQLHDSIYNVHLKAILNEKLGLERIVTDDLELNVVRLFLHGSNSVVLRQHLVEGRLGPMRYMSDFDMVCLVNDDLGPRFMNVRTILVMVLLTALMNIITDVSWHGKLLEAYADIGLTYEPGNGKFNVYEDVGKHEDDESLNKYFQSAAITDFQFPEGTPIFVNIIPNVSFRGPRGDFINLGLGNIKIMSATNPPRELFDISFPSRQSPLLVPFWHTTQLERVSIGDAHFYIPVPLSSYLEQRIGSSSNNRPTKRNARLARARTMRNIVRANRNRSRRMENLYRSRYGGEWLRHSYGFRDGRSVANFVENIDREGW